MSAQIKEIERKIEAARAEQSRADAEHKKATAALREADSAVTILLAQLRTLREAEDRKLPQCKIMEVQTWRKGRLLDACICGVTKKGMLRVRQIGSEHVDLFAWDKLQQEYRARSRDFYGYLRDVPPEFMPEYAR